MSKIEKQKVEISKKLSKEVKAGIGIGASLLTAAAGVVAAGEASVLGPVQSVYDKVKEQGTELAGKMIKRMGFTNPFEEKPIGAKVEAQASFSVKPQKAQETTEATEETKESIPEIKSKLLLNNVEMPMWYLENSGMEWVKDTEFVVSAVVVGSPKKSIGESNKEELMIPIAFQNPITKDYYVRDLSLGTPEFYQYGFGMVDLKNHSFLRPDDSYTAYFIKTENLIERLKTGDQIAFTLLISLKSWDEKAPSDYKKTSEYKTVYEFYTLYLSNNNAVIEAMKQNEELPNEIICPNMFFINK